MQYRDIVQNVAMKAVIEHEGKVLLLRESSHHDTNTHAGQYQFPGGRVEPGEHFLDGLKREVMEEAGLRVSVGEPLFVGEWRPIIKGVQHQIIATYLICTADSSEVAISEEHDGFVWATLEEARRLDLMPPDDQVIEAYFKRQKA